MELFLWYIWTIIFSFCLESINLVKIFKKAAESGFKINRKYLKDFQEYLNNQKSETLLIFIGINIITSLERLIINTIKIDKILYDMKIMNVITKMNEEEILSYEQDCSLFNWWMLSYLEEEQEIVEEKKYWFKEIEILSKEKLTPIEKVDSKYLEELQLLRKREKK